MVNESIDILEELSSASNVHHLKRDDIDNIMFDFAKRLTLVLRIERINVWLLNKDKSAIISIGEYDLRTQKFFKETSIQRSACPNYFDTLASNKFIYVEDGMTDERVIEIRDNYMKTNEVITMVDVPLRMGGEMFGVMCFEKTGTKPKKFLDSQLTFMYSVATVLASNLEARYRRAIQHRLDRAIAEKELLIKEINHRVKNNFAVLISLLRISKSNASMPELKILCEEYEQRIFSMLKIHDMLYQNQQYTEVNLGQYLNELVSEFGSSYHDSNITFDTKIDYIPLNVSTKNALHVGLAVTEVFLNGIKYGKKSNKPFEFRLHFELDKAKSVIRIGDNGKGFDFKEKVDNGTLGLSLIKNLFEGIDAKVNYPQQGSSYYEVVLQ